MLLLVYRGMALGGGEAYRLAAVLLRALSHAAGGPSDGLLALACGVGFAAATIAGLRALAARGARRVGRLPRRGGRRPCPRCSR